MTPTPCIVLLEHEPVPLMTARHQLRDLGALHEFSHPRDALEFVRTHEVDAVVTDINMPDLHVDGLWFLAEMWQTDRKLAAVVRTGTPLRLPDHPNVPPVRSLVKGRHTTADFRAAVESAIAATRAGRALAHAT